MKPIYLIVAGSRNFDDYDLMKQVLDEFIISLNTSVPVIIVSGTARGADSLGEQYSQERNLMLMRKPADWGLYGNSAGYIRNQEMARVGTHLVAFWVNKSRGTKHMIDIALEEGLFVKIVRVIK